MNNQQKNLKINNSQETRIALLEQSIGHVGQSLLRLESKIDKMDLRIDKIDNRLLQIIFLISLSIIPTVLGKLFHWF